jgi:hypothetical protein
MIDWTKLGSIARGLAVEGPTDKAVIEAFLDAGERAGRWQDWRSKLLVEVATGLDEVLRELEIPQNVGVVWGLIDQDWRSASSQSALQTKYGNTLLILPRIQIDNYFIDPDELEAMFPPSQRTHFTAVRAALVAKRDDWMKQGAMSKALVESGAEEFCSSGGYKLLRQVPVPDDTSVMDHLAKIYANIEPSKVFNIYQMYWRTFQSSVSPYHHCISGKLFFKQVVMLQLNHSYGGREYKIWIADLTSSLPDCPTDIAPMLQSLMK